MRKGCLILLAVWAVTALLIPISAQGESATGNNNNTVTVITEGYVKAMEGHQLIPGVLIMGQGKLPAP